MRKISTSFFAFFLFFFIVRPLFSQAATEKQPSVSSPVTVARVMDIATLKLEDGRDVSLIGIDYPEIYMRLEEGQKTLDLLKHLVAGKKVKLEFDVSAANNSGRLSAYVFIPVCGTNWLEAKDGVVQIHLADDGVNALSSAGSFDEKCPKGLYPVNLNGYLIQYGYAQLGAMAPDAKYAALFRELSHEAKNGKRGWWREKHAR